MLENNNVFKEKQRVFHVRVVKLIFERTALLDCQGVGLPAELVPHHLEVAGDEVLVANISRVRCQ